MPSLDIFHNAFHKTKAYWRRRFFYWLDKRSPLARSVQLNRRNLYIFPSRSGFGLMFVALLIWLIGTNYQNNLVLGLGFLLFGLLIVTILNTYANLAGLSIKAVKVEPVFCGDEAVFELSFMDIHGRVHDGLTAQWEHSSPVTFAIQRGTKQIISLSLTVNQRGYCRPGRLLIETIYPLGLVRCWTWLNIDIEVLVYPRPIAVPELPFAVGQSAEDKLLNVVGGDEFYNLKTYQTGDSIRHIAWKRYARDQGLFIKEYAQPLAKDRWLDWELLPGLDAETRLSGLCYWALEYHHQQIPYGLRLPGLEIEPGYDEGQRQKILRALAECPVDSAVRGGT